MSDRSPEAEEGRQPDPDRIRTPQEFGRELTLLRHRANQTVRQVAKAAGLPASTAGDYFSGRHLPAPGQGLGVVGSESLHKLLAACGETDPVRLGQWTEALGRARRPPGRRALGMRVASGDAPYRGLASFGPQDAPWFFGREDVTQRLVELATGWGIGAGVGLPLIVVGPSGSGKSSLLAAGLTPRLTGPVTLFVPTATPAADLSVQLTADPRYVIVDQFEAVFTRCQDEDQRREFITAVCELAMKATVILALRADFYGQALRYPGLATALQSRQVVLGPMTAEQVRQVIVAPARRAQLEVEDGLVELLLRDLAPKTPKTPTAPDTQGAYEPGALPLLSHALLSTWELSSTSTITIADYQASGGISDAITRTAEGVFAELPDGQQEMARRLFLRLVHVADDTPPTRSVVPLAELDSWNSSATDLLGRFVDERLITVDADHAQIAHDALLTAWPRLRSWIDAGQDDLRTRRRITEAARIWEETGRDSSALPRGLQLAITTDWAGHQDNHASLSPLAREFVTAAVAEERAGNVLAVGSRSLQLWDPVTRRLLATVPAPGGTFVNAVAFSPSGHVLAAGYGNGTFQLRSPAGLALGPPVRASAAGLVEYVAFSPSGAMIATGGDDGTVRLWSVSGSSVRLVAVVHDSGTYVYSVAFSPSGHVLAAASADDKIRLWSVADPSRPVALGPPLTGPGSYAISVAFSPNGQFLAVGSADKTVRLWSVADPARPVPLGPPLTGPGSYVYSVTFSPDGKTLAAGVTDGTVWLWNLAVPAHPSLMATINGPNGHVYSVAFSPSGGMVAAGSADGTVRLWDTSASAAVAAECADSGQPITRLEWDNYVPGTALPGAVLVGMSEAVRGLPRPSLTWGRTGKFMASWPSAGWEGGQPADGLGLAANSRERALSLDWAKSSASRASGGQGSAELGPSSGFSSPRWRRPRCCSGSGR